MLPRPSRCGATSFAQRANCAERIGDGRLPLHELQVNVVDREDPGCVAAVEPYKPLEVALQGLLVFQTSFDQPFCCLKQLVEVPEYALAAHVVAEAIVQGFNDVPDVVGLEEVDQDAPCCRGGCILIAGKLRQQALALPLSLGSESLERQ